MIVPQAFSDCHIFNWKLIHGSCTLMAQQVVLRREHDADHSICPGLPRRLLGRNTGPCREQAGLGGDLRRASGARSGHEGSAGRAQGRGDYRGQRLPDWYAERPGQPRHGGPDRAQVRGRPAERHRRPLSTPVAQSMVAAIPDIPVVFSAVSDAVGSTCSAGYGRKSWTTRSCSPNENTDIGTVLATYSTEEMAWIC